MNVVAFEVNYNQGDYDKEYQKLKERELFPLSHAETSTLLNLSLKNRTGNPHPESTHTHKDQQVLVISVGRTPQKSAEYSSGFQLLLLGHSISRWEIALNPLLSIATDYNNIFRLAQEIWETVFQKVT